MEINLETANQYRIFRDVLQKAINLDYDLSETTMVGYNSHSGYVWLWSENENYSIGIADYAWNRDEAVQCILTCPETGEEFIDDTPQDCYDLYDNYCTENGYNNEYK